MSLNTQISVAKQDIPLHTFRMGIDTTRADIPIECLSFSAAPALAQATYPHRHDFYEVLYITGGAGTHYIDFNAYEIKPNTFYFISPGQVHYWETTVPIEGEILVFTSDFLLLAPSDYMVLHELSFFHTVEGKPTLTVGEADHAHIQALFQSLAAEFRSNKFRTSSVLRAYLHILLIHIQRICAQQDDASDSPADNAAQSLTRQFKQLVAQPANLGQSVNDYASQLSVSVNHLNKIIKTTTGYTPGQLIRQEVVLEAKRLFRHTELNATEIAFRLGFTDPSYFGRYFKREVGVSPGQFRQAFA